jgi:hypothetical protein
VITRQKKDDEITIIGSATYELASPHMANATIGVLNGQYFILLFEVAPNIAKLLKTPLEQLDTMDKYVLEQHVRELVDEHVADPLVEILTEAFDLSENLQWSKNFGYLADLSPPKRYVTIYPPKTELEPFEYVTKLLTQTREKGPVMKLEFKRGDDGYEEEDEEG